MRVKIRLRDTDATGVIYFTELMRLALEVLEEQFSLKKMLEQEKFLLPIVHAEADYFSPVTVGDDIDIKPSVKKIGTTSVTLHYQFWKEQEKVGEVTIVHVAVSTLNKSAISIPQSVLDVLKTL